MGKKFYPWDKVLKNAMKLRERLSSAEKEYEEASKIMAKLNGSKEEKREALSLLGRKVEENYKNLRFRGNLLTDDFPYDKISALSKEEIEEKRKKAKEEYGLRIYPIVIFINIDSVDEGKRMDEFFNGLIDYYYCGKHVPNALGSIGVSIYFIPSEDFLREMLPRRNIKDIDEKVKSYMEKMAKIVENLHEEFHDAFSVYRHDIPEKVRGEEDISRMLLNELNSYRTDVREGVLGWRDVYEALKGRDYLEAYLLSAGDYEKSSEERWVKKLNYVCNEVMPDLQSRYDERVITKVFMKARDLDDLIKWYEDPERRKIMDVWNERYK